MRRATRLAAAIAMAAAIGIPAPGRAEPAVCTWGGTVAEPTGTFTISPGMSNQTPAAVPLHLIATGRLEGPSARCTGTLTLDAQIFPGSYCRAFLIHGRMIGMPGVAWAFDAGGAYSRAVLYDEKGAVVGSYGAAVLHQGTADLIARCSSPGGLTDGAFWATVEVV